VQRRNAQTLLPIIQNVVRPGSTIHTDEWAAYNALGQSEQYFHHRITHKYNFVDPISGVHTQHVESFNNKLKCRIKNALGVKRSFVDLFVVEFLFCDTFKRNLLEKLFEIIKV
jgi:transposase-like protein